MLPRTKTRAIVARSCTRGRRPSLVCTDCVRYTSGTSRLTPVPAVIVIAAVAVFDGSAADVTTMFAAPAVIARTMPVDDTVATLGVLLVKSTFVLVLPVTDAVSCCV